MNPLKKRPQKIRTNDMETTIGHPPKSPFSQVWEAPDYCESRHIKPAYEVMEKNRCVLVFPDTSIQDRYKVLRTQIEQRMRQHKINTMMITSPGKRNGKTQTTINLGITFAKGFKDTVMLVDCDFEKQDMGKYFGIQGSSGLIDTILDDVPLSDIIIWPGIEKITLISGGRKINEGSEILGSPKMAGIVEEMKHRYPDRYVFFDVPEVLNRAEALAFAPLVDCILLVIEEGKTSHKELTATLNLLPQDKLIGYVVNKSQPGN